MKLNRGTVVGPGGRVGQFWTPPPTAAAFARWCGITPDLRVIDLGAGLGALSLAAAACGARVTAVEVDEQIAARATPVLERVGVTLVVRDVLASSHRQVQIETGHAHDIAISNPPWEKNLPVRFAESQLERAPLAAQIVPLNFLAAASRAKFWRWTEIVAMHVLARRPDFGGAYSGGMRDVMFVMMRRRARARASAFDTDLAQIGVGA